MPKFQSDEDAINRLGVLLRLVGKNPILLVLDDVWPSSEALVEKFKIDIPDYKILVTSRVSFPRFGTPCQLDKLDHDHAVALFCHFAQLNGKSSYMPDEKLVDEVHLLLLHNTENLCLLLCHVHPCTLGYEQPSYLSLLSSCSLILLCCAENNADCERLQGFTVGA